MSSPKSLHSKTLLFLTLLFLSILFTQISSWAQQSISCQSNSDCARYDYYLTCVNGQCTCGPNGTCITCSSDSDCSSSFLSYYFPGPFTCDIGNYPPNFSPYGQCVCTSSTCTPSYQCGSSQGYDNCGRACVATPGPCPSDQYCDIYTNTCHYHCPNGNFSCNLPVSGNVSSSNSSFTNDPVNIATGEAYFSSTDFSLSAQGPKLALFRQYRSFSTFIGMFGYGWRSEFDINLTQDGNGNVTIYDRDGTQLNFTYASNSGTYNSNMGNYYSLYKDYDNSFILTDKNGIMRNYDTTGRLIRIMDRNDNFLYFAYNPTVPGGTYVQDTSGRKIVLSIDSNGHIILATDPSGKNFQYGYDTNGNLISVTDPSGAVTNYIYDSDHKIIQFTNSNSHNTYYQYDSQGRAVMTSRDNNVNKTTLNYQANNTTVVTDSLGNNTTYVFNSTGLQVSRTDPLGNVITQTWDDNMNRISLTDSRNNVTNFEYDSAGNLIQITDPLSNETSMTYTPNYNLISSKTDALGNETNYSYDDNGNLTGIKDASGNTYSFICDQYGNVLKATDSLRNSTNFTYDAFGHVIQKTDAQGNSTNFTYE